MALQKVNEISLDNANVENESKIIVTPSSNEIPTLYSIIKCSTNKSSIKSIEARWLKLIKISKSVVLNLNNLTTINLSDNNLKKIAKKYLILKSLTVLCLDNNQITSIPSFIKNFSSLEELSLNGNLITSIPTSIQYCSHLKAFKISHNKIASLPIEFGLLKSLQILHIDSNYFVQIPTTFCYLKQLNAFKLEWFEFLEPKMHKEQKDTKGIQVINSMRTFLQEMVSKSQLYCEFHVFIDKANRFIQKKMKEEVFQTFETEKIEYQNKNIQQRDNNNNIFFAVENNYYGIVKAFILSNEELLRSKNNDNHTPFYISIAFNQNDIINYMLTKINMKTFPNAYLFLHKAIKTRNYNLLIQLSSMGIDLNAFDDQGSTSYHLLFSAFSKSIENCCLIGNFLLEKKVKGLNTANFEKWAPIHVAARRGSVDCIKWIKLQNNIREKKGEEVFNLNLKGKNNWTPLHLSVSGFFYNETLLLLIYGCDLFNKNKEGKTPRKVTHNYFLTKLLYFQEKEFLNNKYFSNPNINSSRLNHHSGNIKKINNQSKIKTLAYYSTENKIGNIESSFEEKYYSLELLKQTNNSGNLEKIIQLILKNFDMTNNRNCIILTEILDLIVGYNLIDLMSCLNTIKIQLQKVIKKKIYLEKIVDNTIKLLQRFKSKHCCFYVEKQDDDESEIKTLQYDDNQTDPNYLMYFDEEQGKEQEKEFFKEMNNSFLMDHFVKTNKLNNVIQPQFNNNSNSYDYISESIIQLDEDESH